MLGPRALAVSFALASMGLGQAVPSKWPGSPSGASQAIVVRGEADAARVAAELRAALATEIGPERTKEIEPALTAAIGQVARSIGERWPDESTPSDGKSRRWHE